ncbi:type II toxin-antitoxin system HipA family toxin, partial [Paucibacter sp. R3-3]
MSDLAVWLNGERAATWTQARGSDSLTYEQGWIESPRGRPLSLSLPFTPTRRLTGAVVRNYFENLLPDAKSIRDRLGRRFRVRPNDSFELLSAIGRDCVGAVQLLPPDTEPLGVRSVSYEALDQAQIAEVLAGASTDNSLGAAGAIDDDVFRISLAGAQEKTALLLLGEQWCRPLGSTPTTHILKLPLGLVGGMNSLDMRDSVENEWLCLHLLEKLGLSTARVDIAKFGEQKVLVVTRFDREWMDDGSWIARLPQEDFCQATGTAPDKKYEKDGGPGIAKCMALLGGSEAPIDDRARFLLTQLAFWMLAATDGHAKNFSVFMLAGGAYRLTPLYDVLSAYPIMGHGKGKLPHQKAHLAMSVRGKSAHSQLDYVKPRHWALEARRSGVPDMLRAMVWLATTV